MIWWHLNHWYSMKPVYKACLPILHVSMYGTWLSDDVNKWCPSVAFCVCLFGVVSLFVLSCYKNPCIYKFIQKSVTPVSFVMYFTNYFIRQRSLYLHIHILLLKMSIEFWLCCESGCYIYGCLTQICWYCRIIIHFLCKF